MADLAGKTALVTGAASGIGLATVELFAICRTIHAALPPSSGCVRKALP